MERALTTEEANTRILIASSPDPETCERYLESFQQRHPEHYARLNALSSGLQYLAAVFSYSRFLSEALLQFPEWISIFDAEDLYRVLTVEEFKQRLESSLEHHTGAPPARSLALFRRRELLRILIRDVVGHASLSEITEELSNLADAILDVTYRRIRASLEARYGKPRSDDGNGTESCFSVIALGKLGGRELNYSSDIDLMFVYSTNGVTDGEERITNKEFFKKLSNLYTDLLSTYTSDGTCYRVDLRLLPEGRLGEFCLSLDGG
jgi:glutamate-ammonia-ligase adenylyltransferase